MGLLMSMCKGGVDPYLQKYKRFYQNAEQQFTALKLVEPYTRDFFDVFCAIDTTNEGELDFEEFLKFFGFKKTPYAERVFQEFDLDNSGEIDFIEFVTSVWSYCTMTTANLLRFAFNIYDDDKKGFLDPPECESLLRMVYGDKPLSDELMNIVEEIDADGDGEITWDELVEFARRFPQITDPLEEMQRVLIRNLCGSAFWRTQSEWRQRRFGPNSSMEFIVYHRKHIEDEVMERRAKRQAELDAVELEKKKVREAKMRADAIANIRQIGGKALRTWVEMAAHVDQWRRKLERSDEPAVKSDLRIKMHEKELEMRAQTKEIDENWREEQSGTVAKAVEKANRKAKGFLKSRTGREQIGGQVKQHMLELEAQGVLKKELNSRTFYAEEKGKEYITSKEAAAKKSVTRVFDRLKALRAEDSEELRKKLALLEEDRLQRVMRGEKRVIMDLLGADLDGKKKRGWDVSSSEEEQEDLEATIASYRKKGMTGFKSRAHAEWEAQQSMSLVDDDDADYLQLEKRRGHDKAYARFLNKNKGVGDSVGVVRDKGEKERRGRKRNAKVAPVLDDQSTKYEDDGRPLMAYKQAEVAEEESYLMD